MVTEPYHKRFWHNLKAVAIGLGWIVAFLAVSGGLGLGISQAFIAAWWLGVIVLLVVALTFVAIWTAIP